MRDIHLTETDTFRNSRAFVGVASVRLLNRLSPVVDPRVCEWDHGLGVFDTPWPVSLCLGRSLATRHGLRPITFEFGYCPGIARQTCMQDGATYTIC